MAKILNKQIELDKIAKEIENCKICKKGKIGKAVPGEGSANADVMFVGEAPGKKEAETGRPFIGRAGKLLRQMFVEAGLKDEDVFITSAVKYLPEYVTPKPADIEHGRIHLFAQFKIIKPQVVVLLGNVASQAVLKEKFPIAQIHGTLIEKDGIKYLIVYHPAAPLYNPNLRQELKNDFKKLKEILYAKKG